jgi:hypothetical protein
LVITSRRSISYSYIDYDSYENTYRISAGKKRVDYKYQGYFKLQGYIVGWKKYMENQLLFEFLNNLFIINISERFYNINYRNIL